MKETAMVHSSLGYVDFYYFTTLNQSDLPRITLYILFALLKMQEKSREMA
jgi:hypothetical protein